MAQLLVMKALDNRTIQVHCKILNVAEISLKYNDIINIIFQVNALVTYLRFQI